MNNYKSFTALLKQGLFATRIRTDYDDASDLYVNAMVNALAFRNHIAQKLGVREVREVVGVYKHQHIHDIKNEMFVDIELVRGICSPDYDASSALNSIIDGCWKDILASKNLTELQDAIYTFVDLYYTILACNTVGISNVH